MRRRLMPVVGLETFALLLAWLQSLGGARTDEAKYLLDIPYPHPPLMRGFMNLTEILPFQEMLWRMVLASLFIQAVWLVWDMGRALSRDARVALCSAWLLAGGVLFWAGTVMIAPINALQGLVLLWLLSRPEYVRKAPLLVGMFWLASLLTGYQAVLYAPIAAAVFLRAGFTIWQSFVYVCGPVGILALATLANPFAVASLVHHGGEQLAATAQYKVFHTGRLWFIAGSCVLSLMGTLGILWSRRWELWLSFAFVAGFVFLNWFEYYSALFTPLLIAGLVVFFQRRRVIPQSFVVLMVAGALVTITLYPLRLSGSAARPVMDALRQRGIEGPVMLSGSFGHEWQYESRMPLLRYVPEKLQEAAAVVCLDGCPAWIPGAQWTKIPALVVPVWVRRGN